MATTHTREPSTARPTARPTTRPLPAAILTRVALPASGIGFVLYPALRPFSDETTLAGARAYASAGWLWAHSIAIVSFVLLGLGLTGWLLTRLADDPTRRGDLVALVLAWVGIGLTLPYYGAEVFGLHALGRAALDGDATALHTVDTVRWQQGLWFIVVGLVLLAAAAVMVAVTHWRTGIRRWLGVPLAVSMALYLPQFMGSQPVRVAHGVLLLVGCSALALSIRTGKEGSLR